MIPWSRKILFGGRFASVGQLLARPEAVERGGDFMVEVQEVMPQFARAGFKATHETRYVLELTPPQGDTITRS